MKRLLLPLLAAFALPTAANAESYWLIIIPSSVGARQIVIEKIEMASMEQCHEEAKKWANSETMGWDSKGNYHCMKGK